MVFIDAPADNTHFCVLFTRKYCVRICEIGINFKRSRWRTILWGKEWGMEVIEANKTEGILYNKPLITQIVHMEHSKNAINQIKRFVLLCAHGSLYGQIDLVQLNGYLFIKLGHLVVMSVSFCCTQNFDLACHGSGMSYSQKSLRFSLPFSFRILEMHFPLQSIWSRSLMEASCILYMHIVLWIFGMGSHPVFPPSIVDSLVNHENIPPNSASSSPNIVDLSENTRKLFQYNEQLLSSKR